MLAAMAAARQLLALLVFLPQLAASADTASSLSAALAPYPALSTFQQLVDKHASTVDALVPPRNSSAGRLDVTVLAPSNQAFETYILQNGPLTNLSASALKNFLSYHILVAPLSSANLSSDDHPRGLTVPTLLTPELYNNRSAGQGLTASYGKNATGQVVYVQQQLPARPGRPGPNPRQQESAKASAPSTPSSRPALHKRSISPCWTSAGRAAISKWWTSEFSPHLAVSYSTCILFTRVVCTAT